MSKPIVICLGEIKLAQEAWDKLAETAEILYVPTDMTRDKFIKLLNDPQSKYSKAKIIARTYDSISKTGRFDKEIAENMPSSVIAVCHDGAGYDQIDVVFFNDRHIQVSHTPKQVSIPTAVDHVFLLIGTMRNFSYSLKSLNNGVWPNGNDPKIIGHDAEVLTVGMLGLGGIAKEVVKRLKPFGFKKIIYHTRTELPTTESLGCEHVSFNELLSQADIISVNVPLNASTRHLIGVDAITKMKDGVKIVNTSRGAVIDEKAMIAALKSGKISAVGLDVFETEPNVDPELLKIPQVLALPHLGTRTSEAIKNMEEHVVANVQSALDTGKVISCVPEIKNQNWFMSI